MNQPAFIIFVCEHGAAKSVIATAYFNKMASEKNLNISAIARGTSPDPELSPQTVTGLQKDGLIPIESAPKKLSLAEAKSAQYIVAFCELPEEYRNTTSITQWDSIPPVSENYEIARDAILEKLHQLMK